MGSELPYFILGAEPTQIVTFYAYHNLIIKYGG